MCQKKSELGSLIRDLLKKNLLSMRKLSALSGIDTATISRIVNGKQRANMNHLQNFSKYLNVPIEKLLIADGYDIDVLKNENFLNSPSFIKNIQELLRFSNLLDYHYDLSKIEDELDKYKRYAVTKEGKNTIYKNFKEKIEDINGSGLFVDELKQMYERFCDENASEEIHALLGSGLLYFILSVDIIPDYIFPFGYLDDVIAIKLILHHIAEVNAKDEKLLQK
ncbi:helix-turn-helix domain-containing protein [Clostridium sp. Mt-5]|uniref:Helix-turn-helix domain-containing protein n=1 Tax=Clostridium moutaii TaxID=3240932 RepID=A0ABV4BUF1_9CLOT